MHRLPPTNRSVKQKLIDDLNQLKKHVDRFEKESKEKIHESYLIYNFCLEDYQDLIEEAKENGDSIHVIDFTLLDEAIASLVPKED
jgi:hypothetical protein